MKVTTHTPQIFTIDHFLSEHECKNLINDSERAGYEPAKVEVSEGIQKIMTGVRNNERILFNDKSYADLLWSRLKAFAPQKIGNSLAIGLNELFRFYKYSAGQRFKMHADQSYIRNKQEASYYTFMIYLNQDYDGGETNFEAGPIIRPSTGKALIFYHPLNHEGAVIKTGIKYVLRTDIMYKLANNDES